MINTANYNARIQQKSDTLDNWAAQNPVLLFGEMVVVTECPTDVGPSVRLKVGDGSTAFNDLGFLDTDVVTALSNTAGILDEHSTDINELQESKVEIDNQTIIKGEDGKIKAVPDPILEKAKLTNGIGWQESSTIVYTSDMYDAAEKFYMTNEDTGEQKVFLVKISDEVITRDELQGICSLTFTYGAEGESGSITIDRADPDYEIYFSEKYAYFGTTGVVIAGGYGFSCSQDEDASELLDEQLIIPAGTWLEAGIASAYSSVIIKHGLLGKISKEYLPSDVVFASLQDWEDDESFNTYIREPFSKGKTVIAKYYSSDYCLVLSVDKEVSSFTATKNDGLIYKYTLADGNWTINEEVYVQSSQVMAYEEELTASTAASKIPIASSVYNLINSRTLPTGQNQGDMVIWDYTNSCWILAHAQGGCGYSYYTATETITEKIKDMYLPDSVVVRKFTESGVHPSGLAEALEAGNTVYWSTSDANKEGGRVIGWEIIGDVNTTDCQFILTFDRSPTARKIYTPDSAHGTLSLSRYTATALQSELYLSTNYSSDNKTYKITASSGGHITLNDGTNNYYISPLKPATATGLGGIKVGSNLSITEDGTLSADAMGSYEDLSDKPFYDTRAYEPINITWDGDTTGKVTDTTGVAYKVSDTIFDLADCDKLTCTDTSWGTVIFTSTAVDGAYSLSDLMKYQMTSDGKLWSINDWGPIVVMEDNYSGGVPGSIPSTTFPEKGVYFLASNRSLTATMSTPTGELKQIDSKYIPEDYINSLIDAKLGVIENGSY